MKKRINFARRDKKIGLWRRKQDIYKFAARETCSTTRRRIPSVCTCGDDLLSSTFRRFWRSRTTFTKSAHRPRANWNSTGCMVTEAGTVEAICIYYPPVKSFISSQLWWYCTTWRSTARGITWVIRTISNGEIIVI